VALKELSSVLYRMFVLILKMTPNDCRHLKSLCKLGLTPEFGLRTKSDLFFKSHPLYGY